MSAHIGELARQVREHTVTLLDSAPDEALLWAPAGTSNHVLWHAGHALWVVDLLGVGPLAGRTELPEGWAETFGADCLPVAERTEWPRVEDVRSLLVAQGERLVQLIGEHAGSLGEVPADGGWELTRGVIHALHDEARHQGEMYLLLKLHRAGA